ncbi:hypothetical protein LP420_38390 [Massilia sp. B-10]|nr:hypothetical protein LP420_38390 [Massilia sp. B-10]
MEVDHRSPYWSSLKGKKQHFCSAKCKGVRCGSGALSGRTGRIGLYMPDASGGAPEFAGSVPPVRHDPGSDRRRIPRIPRIP